MSGLAPQVIKRGDKYVLHNMDLGPYTRTQKLAVAVQVWDQVRMLMEANGQYKARDPHTIGSTGIGITRDVDAVVAEMLGIKHTSLSVIRPRLMRRTDVVEKLLSGEIDNLHDAQRALGMRIRAKLAEGAESKANSPGYYGQGDKFDEVMEVMSRYLAARKKQGFKYPHVAPRAAQRRVSVIDGVIAGLVEAKADLESRSQVATLTAPAEGKRKERS